MGNLKLTEFNIYSYFGNVFALSWGIIMTNLKPYIGIAVKYQEMNRNKTHLYSIIAYKLFLNFYFPFRCGEFKNLPARHHMWGNRGISSKRNHYFLISSPFIGLEKINKSLLLQKRRMLRIIKIL